MMGVSDAKAMTKGEMRMDGAIRVTIHGSYVQCPVCQAPPMSATGFPPGWVAVAERPSGDQLVQITPHLPSCGIGWDRG
jgi:hypothetical protein